MNTSASCSSEAPFEQLDFLYTPSRDVAAHLAYFADVLGGRVAFAVEAMGARVAGIELGRGPPLVLLADHVEGDRAILVYRVADLRAMLVALESRGWTQEATSRSRTGRAARSELPGVTVSRCMSARAQARVLISTVAGTSE